jgi:hypothetical protein
VLQISRLANPNYLVEVDVIAAVPRLSGEVPLCPKDDGTYLVEFKTAAGDALAISIPRTEAAVIRHFQSRMPYGLVVPDVS